MKNAQQLQNALLLLLLHHIMHQNQYQNGEEGEIKLL